jgi:hypothetical protein
MKIILERPEILPPPIVPEIEIPAPGTATISPRRRTEPPKTRAEFEILRKTATLADRPPSIFDRDGLLDGAPCGHPGCLSHISHPCEGCGRTGGRYYSADRSE